MSDLPSVRLTASRHRVWYRIYSKAERFCRVSGVIGARALNVLEAADQKRVCVRQAASAHCEEGTQVSALPVSKQPVKATGGVPSLNTPKYCVRRSEQAGQLSGL